MNSSVMQGRALRHFAWFSALLLALSYVLSGLMYQTPVYADEVTSRSITMSTSEAGATASYQIQFTVPDTGAEDIGSFRVEFCDSDPLANLTCTFDGSGDDIPDLDSASINGTPTFDGESFDALSVTPGDHYLTFTLDTATTDITSDETFDVTVDDIVNPTNSTDGVDNNTFYARIYVYDSITPPAGANPMPTTNQIHNGGVAISTAEQLTVTARVQEILEFCVGTSTQPGVDECADMAGNSVDLGILDFASVNRATTESSPSQGSIMVRTNASIGVVVDYFAVQDSTGTEHEGALRVQGATCDAADPSTDETDQCINSVGWDGATVTQTELTAGVEAFGLCVFNVDDTGSADGGTQTNNLEIDTDYDGLCDNSAGNGYAFDESGSTDTIADSVGSGGVINDEMLEIDFSGTADLTTPSGLYTVTLTFIGTATF